MSLSPNKQAEAPRDKYFCVIHARGPKHPTKLDPSVYCLTLVGADGNWESDFTIDPMSDQRDVLRVINKLAKSLNFPECVIRSLNHAGVYQYVPDAVKEDSAEVQELKRRIDEATAHIKQLDSEVKGMTGHLKKLVEALLSYKKADPK